MYSLKYGTVPIVRATGGLDDSIEPFDVEHGTGTGFKFKEYTGEALLFAVRQELHHYMDERIWKRIQLNGMAKDFSWKTPAAEYAKLYEAARVARGLSAAVKSSGKAARSKGQPTQQPTKEPEQAPQSSAQAERKPEQTAQATEQTPKKSGQGARNQKRAGTSN